MTLQLTLKLTILSVGGEIDESLNLSVTETLTFIESDRSSLSLELVDVAEEMESTGDLEAGLSTDSDTFANLPLSGVGGTSLMESN